MKPERAAVPLLDLRAQYAALREPIDAALRRVLERQEFIGGAEVEALEQEIARSCGARHAVGCASGSDALLLALMALRVGPGDQVVCPSYTFFATAGAVARLGAEPVFADLDPTTCNAESEQLLRAAEDCRRLKAVVPVHLFGRAAELDELERFAQARGAAIVADAAQAIGAVDARGRRVGASATATSFSFFPSKNLGGWGDGGMVATDDTDLAARLRALRTHGARRKYEHELVGMNSRLDALQAAVLRAKLPHLEAWNEARRANASHYEDIFRKAGAEGADTPWSAGGLPLRVPLAPRPPARHVFHQYVVRVPARLRDGLRAHLAARRIGSAVYYPRPLHLQRCFRGLGYAEGRLPEAERAARETLALPVHPELSGAQRSAVAGAVVEYLRRAEA